MFNVRYPLEFQILPFRFVAECHESGVLICDGGDLLCQVERKC